MSLLHQVWSENHQLINNPTEKLENKHAIKLETAMTMLSIVAVPKNCRDLCNGINIIFFKDEILKESESFALEFKLIKAETGFNSS